RKRRPLGRAFLALIPLTAFALGTWPIQRLNWKTDPVARYEDRLMRAPLPLPPRLHEASVEDVDFRLVTAAGRFRHGNEMLPRPRIHEGENGFMVVTPLDRPDGASTILVSRGWIPKVMMDQSKRAPGALPQGEVTIEGLLRGKEVWKKNMFTPENRP